MKAVATALTFFTACFVSQSAIGAIGGPIFNPANGHNYYLVGANTWTLAQNAGLSLGGNLVTINDAAENAWLKTNFLDPNPTINPWIGMQDIDNNGIWNWISGETVSYLNWAPGEPNFSFERVSNIFPANHSLAGRWNNAYDDPSSGVLFGIVEVPEPSCFALSLILGAGLTVARRRRNA